MPQPPPEIVQDQKMKIRQIIIVAGLGVSLVTPSCSIFRGSPTETEPWVNMGVTEEQYEAMQKWEAFLEVYYENIDYDREVEKIIVKSIPFRNLPEDQILSYSNTVEIYIKRGDVEKVRELTGEKTRTIGENVYHLKKAFMWRGTPIKSSDVLFENKILNVQGREIGYDRKRDNFYIKKQAAENKRD
jgi:hypothetical protein